jgi:hypothetical protein
MSVSKRSAVKAVFGNIPVDAEYLDWLYARRLATVPDGKWRELAYVVKLDELEHAIMIVFQDRCLKPLGHPSKPLKLFSDLRGA